MLRRNEGVVVDEEKPAKRAKPGPKTERKKGGLKCQRDDENDQEKSPNARKLAGRRRGRVGVKTGCKSPPLQPVVGVVAGKLRYCWFSGITLASLLAVEIAIGDRGM
ncbi:hypothetical protein DFH09DRAFT_1081848 [Mycena vulgaris]|nr:hypothetical protein DFH09DRAFT_1081848 [Mycena vulgaris]